MKRKNIALLVILTVAFFILPILSQNQVYADTSGEAGDNVTWTISSDGTLTIAGTGAVSDMYSIDNYPWTKYQNEIVSLIIEDGVTSIPKNAFKDFLWLKNVTMSDSVERMADGCFEGCISLKSVVLSDKLPFIEAYTFENCKSLVNVNVPTNATIIGRNAFYGCTKLNEITMADKIESIEENAFSGCINLNKIILNEQLKAICSQAFYECPIKEVYYNGSIDNWVNIIFKNRLFEDGGILYFKEGNDYKPLESVSFNRNISKIGANAFYGCMSIKNVNIDGNVKMIDEYAFGGCKNLETINLVDVAIIGELAFVGCTSLNTLKILGETNCIDSLAFGSCYSLKDVILSDEITEMSSIIFDECKSLERIKLPKGITEISTQTFMDCQNLKEVVIENNVKSIQEDAFKNCNNLKYIFFTGDEEHWKSINIGYWGNEHLRKSYIHYETTDHILGDEIISINPTCTEMGISSRTCAFCDYMVERTIDALGHEYEDIFTIDCKETCINPGQKSRHCTRCGVKSDITSIPAKGHNPIIDIALEPTCTETGLTEGSHCEVCGEVLKTQEEIPALGHSYKITKEVKEAQCTEAGNKEEKTCETCGKVVGGETIEALGHKSKTVVTKATMKVNGKKVVKCSRCDEILKTTTIYSAKTVKLAKSKYAYSGKTITPTVVVKDSKAKALVKGTDYTVSMAKGRTKVGYYKITVTGKGKYSFTKELKMTIKPNPTSIVKASPGKKSFTVKWKKKAVQVDGYEIQYSTSSGFKTGNKAATIKSSKTTSRVCKSLKAKKTYYVRVRTYKAVNGKKIYSVWSAKKSVKTK